MHLIVFPTSAKRQYLNYIKTVEYSVSLDKFYESLKPDEKNFFKKDNKNNFHIWATLDGPNQVFKKLWEKSTINDECIFYRSKTFFSKAKIIYKFRNEKTALKIWGRGHEGQVYKNIYVLNEIKNISIESHTLTDFIPAMKNGILTSMQLINLNTNLKNALKDKAKEKNNYHLYQNKLNELSSLLDMPIRSKRRIEHRILSEYLFGNSKKSKCAICSKIYPNEIMVTAHIKKRSKSNTKEKKDLNIVMPVCKIGCDELFEQGYIYVDNNGCIRINEAKNISDDLMNYLKNIDNKKCYFYNDYNKKFFKSHREFTLNK
jgi:predicted restriction endonuclease